MAHCLLHTSMLPSKECVSMYSPFLWFLFPATIISSLHISCIYIFFEAKYCSYFFVLVFLFAALLPYSALCISSLFLLFPSSFVSASKSSVLLYYNPRLFRFFFFLSFLLISFLFRYFAFSTFELLSITLRPRISGYPPTSGGKDLRSLATTR